MANDIRTSALKNPIDLAEYLFLRLKEVGIHSIHGVPGDYNLVALDYIPKLGLEWVGNVNELNASYAADGYARIKGMSAMVTTFGVGELSALNGIAGSYSEYVPVVHIVGTPSTLSQADGMILHHTLGNGDFTVFTTMSSNISCAVSRLNNVENAAELVDHAIQECYLKSRPVYITLPTDNVTKKVEGERLKTPIDLHFSPNNQEEEDFVVNHVLELMKAAKNPVILVDACAIRHRAVKEVQDFVDKSGLPTFVAPMGKGAIDETRPNYCGVYAGDASKAEVRNIVESSDLVLSIGSIKSDFNTAGFSYHTSTLSMIEFHSSRIKVKYSKYDGIRMHGVLKKITEQMPKMQPAKMIKPSIEPSHDMKDQTMTHEWFWPHLSNWVQEGDILISETGTSGYGIWEVLFQKNTKAINQILWGSIGYATGAAQGAALAAKELGHGRTVLFTGEGSFQLTAQELSTMIRHKLNPILFVLCNQGFTIERFIHGMEASYNDIGDWKYKDLVQAFGAEEGSYQTYQIKTKQQMLDLLADKDFANSPKLRFVEYYMPKDDAPPALKLTASASAKNNAKQ